MKTEKTHIGTLVEIWLQREFSFPDGADLDFSIAGQEVDAKWSRNLYEWEIPPEMYARHAEIALVVWANEYTAMFAVGLLRITEAVLVPSGQQRDKKRKLNDAGKDSILWLHRDLPLIKNTLLHLPPDLSYSIATASSGQAAVDLLFHEALGQLIDRAAVSTAAQQIDTQKRVRDARQNLSQRGIVIFGHYDPHPALAAGLGLPVPTLGRFVSARVAPWRTGDPEPCVRIDGADWRLARDGEATVTAPRLPNQGNDASSGHLT